MYFPESFSDLFVSIIAAFCGITMKIFKLYILFFVTNLLHILLITDSFVFVVHKRKTDFVCKSVGFLVVFSIAARTFPEKLITDEKFGRKTRLSC